MVHPERPQRLGATLEAGLTCFCAHVAPPSVDRATLTGAAPLPVKLAQHTYTFPKNSLLAALSAQICSLSANVAELCLDTRTGIIQALLLPATAPLMSSVLDTK